MKNESEIAWTDFTLNPWVGCTKVSPACLNCYAERYGNRFGVEWGMGKPRRQTGKWRQLARAFNNKQHRCTVCGRWMSDQGLEKHIKLCAKEERLIDTRKPSVFCGSLMDVFDPDVDPAWRNDLFNIIAECTGVFWLLLTKRPQFAEMFFKRLPDLPWPNVALGVTAENQEKWNQRVEILSSIPVKARFVSVEPMLSPIEPISYGLDWFILGGESGPKARATDTEWIRAFMNHVRAFHDKPALMVKQLGANPTCSAITRGDYQFIENMRDSHGGNPNEWPKDLRIQQVIRQDHNDNILRRDLV